MYIYLYRIKYKINFVPSQSAIFTHCVNIISSSPKMVTGSGMNILWQRRTGNYTDYVTVITFLSFINSRLRSLTTKLLKLNSRSDYVNIS